jgi:hypothetical protein
LGEAAWKIFTVFEKRILSVFGSEWRERWNYTGDMTGWRWL